MCAISFFSLNSHSGHSSVLYVFYCGLFRVGGGGGGILSMVVVLCCYFKAITLVRILL